jgi:hypothetical protein
VDASTGIVGVLYAVRTHFLLDSFFEAP